MEVDVIPGNVDLVQQSLTPAEPETLETNEPSTSQSSAFNLGNLMQSLTTPPGPTPTLASTGPSRSREGFPEIPVKVHIRRPGKDAWVYLGRATVTQEILGQSSRVGEWYLSVIRPLVLRAADKYIFKLFGLRQTTKS
jgi:hypothetical protein